MGQLTDLHMLVLGLIGAHPVALLDEVALALGLTPAEVEALCSELADAGLIEEMVEQ